MILLTNFAKNLHTSGTYENGSDLAEFSPAQISQRQRYLQMLNTSAIAKIP